MEFSEKENIFNDIKIQTGLISLLMILNLFTIVFNTIAFYILLTNKG